MPGLADKLDTVVRLPTLLLSITSLGFANVNLSLALSHFSRLNHPSDMFHPHLPTCLKHMNSDEPTITMTHSP